MALQREFSIGKKYGPRYGGILKHKVSQITHLKQQKYKCPYCSKDKVKRLSAGIWHCNKCNTKFANKAYTVVKKKVGQTAEVSAFEDVQAMQEEQAQESMQELTPEEKELEKGIKPKF
jgi:ribosomal protein eL43